MNRIDPLALAELIRKEEHFLLDVREPSEHKHFNIGGSLVPLGNLMKEAGTIPRNLPVIVYCKKGIRSQIAIQRLESKFGFTNLINLHGGMEAWKKIFPQTE
ncbi:MAG: molybdopterin-synthase adenylyltransferase MoeB [Bacteroidota bacterium]|jgi:adenylyltransferase/sulfurtransferase